MLETFPIWLLPWAPMMWWIPAAVVCGERETGLGLRGTYAHGQTQTLNAGDLVGSDAQITPLNPLPCPVTIAWLENDEVVSVSVCDKIARERMPQASFAILPGVGHDAMIDDPDLVASTILAVTATV